ncbi:MAG: enoyl-CoA hydratase/isomerase family protein [Acetobacteraceae bacterium]
MDYQEILYSAEERVATITLNRPERLNAINQAMVKEIMDAVARADADPEVRILIVTGAGGKAFSTGYDLKESSGKPKRTLAEWRQRMQADIRFTYSVWDCSKPVIAMIEGYCIAGGLEFATCFDMRYCADDAVFGAIEARFSRGLATMMLPWLVGQRARALVYSGDEFDATEAFRLGLVDRVFPKADLVREVTKIARRMSRVSLECLKWNKRAINQSFEIMGLRNAIAYGAEACTIMDAVGSPEADRFLELRLTEGLQSALKWRAEQFAPYK